MRDVIGLLIDSYMLTAIGIVHGTCLAALVSHISVHIVVDDLPIGVETSSVADGGVQCRM